MASDSSACQHGLTQQSLALPPNASLQAAAKMFHALGDSERLRLLARLASGERCVTELAEMEGQKITTVSNRLKRLLDAGLLVRRREAKHMIYRVADDHVQQLVDNALAHSAETTPGTPHQPRPIPTQEQSMSDHHHGQHPHEHGPNCEHTGIQHGDHVDYLHDGHLHHPAGDTVEEHVIEVSDTNPDSCTPAHECSGHDPNHVHGPNCGHEQVPHGDHIDYLVDGHLHHPHGDHCDDHGSVKVVS